MKKNKIKYIVFIVLLLLTLLILRLFWLAGILACSFLIFGFMTYLISLISISSVQKCLKYVFYVSIIVVNAIVIRVLVADVFLIPSSSMENTLYPKDVILVNKLIYGPKLPKKVYEIPWLNLFYKFKEGAFKEEIEKRVWEHRRLSGVSTVERGDVFVFKVTENRKFIVKRCVSVAGDTLQIINGRVHNNHIKNKSSPHVLNKYEFKIDDIGLFDQQLDSLKLDLSITDSRKFYDDWMETTCTDEEATKIKLLSAVDSIQIKANTKPIKVGRFRWYKDKNWTLDNYGAIVVPKKGMKIEFTEENLMFYKYIIRKHEKIKLKQKKGKVYLDGKEATSYVFKHDYYFMMGDNRHNSTDSRFFGMIPKEKIVGKVQCVLFSNKDDEFQWNRLFKGG